MCIRDSCLAVVQAGLPVYPQIGFDVWEDRHGGSETYDHIMKWGTALEDAGAVMLDLTNVTHEIYREVSQSLRIPVLGGQTGPEADGRIYVSYALVGYRADSMDRTDGGPSAARYIFDIANEAIAIVHKGTW